MWKTTNALGKEVIWYSQEEVKEMLADIKEIAEDHCFFCQKIDPETFDMSECKLCNHSKILLKINEVEDANNNR